MNILQRLSLGTSRIASVIGLVALLLFGSSPSSAASDALLQGLIGFSESMQESLRRDAEAERQLELQKRVLEHQYKLERERMEQAYKLEQERKEQQRIEEVRRLEVARLKQLAADEQKKRDMAEASRRAMATGTGFVIAPGGYLITNQHVVEDKTYFAVRDHKGRFYRATVIAYDTNRDLALLKVSNSFPSLKIANSDSVSKGQRVMAVGYPQISIQGNESKVTDGIISSFSGLQNDDNWFQISVPIQGGNSGGPLVTESGSVVGVVVATANASRYFKLTGNLPQNVNYAIKSNVVLDFLKAQNIQNVANQKGKAGLESVDASTVLVVAKNDPIDVTYTVSPEQVAREERERAKSVAEEAAKRRMVEAEEKKQIAMAAAEETARLKAAAAEERKREAIAATEKEKRLRDEKVAEQKRQIEERAAEKERTERSVALEKRDRELTRAFPAWAEVMRSDMFTSWLKTQAVTVSEMVSSKKVSDVVSVLKRYQLELGEFSENYFQQMGAWKADANGCKFLDPKPGPNETILWDGKCVDGRGSGHGTLTWQSNGTDAQKMTGEFKNGALTGKGKVEFADKGYNEGVYRNGRLEGQGSMVRLGDKGFSYDGNFKDGKPDGHGRFQWKDGGSYEGETRDGKPEGIGKRVYKDGSVFTGDFRSGRADGRGKVTFTTGSIEGEFKSDKPNGYGKLILNDGGSYVGSFLDGKRDGQGTMTLKNGDVYQGSFWANKREGKGRLTRTNGDVYDGDFKNDIPEGNGKYTYRDGRIFEGTFKDGKFDGKGKLTSSDGKSRTAEFSAGKLIN